MQSSQALSTEASSLQELRIRSRQVVVSSFPQLFARAQALHWQQSRMLRCTGAIHPSDQTRSFWQCSGDDFWVPKGLRFARGPTRICSLCEGTWRMVGFGQRSEGWICLVLLSSLWGSERPWWTWAPSCSRAPSLCQDLLRCLFVDTRHPTTFPLWTPKMHLLGFKDNPAFLRLAKVSAKSATWLLLIELVTTISST